jgi:DNA-binding PadR family transcriptional regulator
MTATPLCPLALALLAQQPRRTHELARALDLDHRAAVATLRRLHEHGLVRKRQLRAGPVYQITRRGSTELALQRRLWISILNATG